MPHDFRSLSTRTALVLTAAFASASMTAPAGAQVRGSERSTISQVSNGTTVTIDYARPHVRGRRPVFPDMIEWGHVWTPGANSATALSVDKDVKINGVDVPAGDYSLWFIPGEDAWRFGLHPDERLYHTQPPESWDELISMEVTPEETDFTEALTWEFTQVDPDGLDLRFRWDDVRVDFRVEVEGPAFPPVPPSEAEAITGSYTMDMSPGRALPPEAAGMPEITMTFRFEDGRLLGTFGAPGVFEDEFELLRRAEWVYSPAWMMDGEVFEMELEMYFEFAVGGGVATDFDVRGVVDDRIDRLMWRGERAR